MHQEFRAAFRRRRADAPLLGIAALVAAFAAGCDKAKEEPVPATATVVMPGSPAPTDASSAPSVSAPPTLVSSSNSGGDGAMTTAPPAATGSIARGNSGPASGGTLSIVPGSPGPAPGLATTPPVTTPVAPAAPLDPTPPPPALTASPPGPGRIGPDPAANPSNDQPPSVPPGTKS
jgi:hypothetical protein